MNDIESLEQRLSADIAAASDEAALESVRVAALGKKGAVSELLKSLGGMGDRPDYAPDERALSLGVDPRMEVVGNQSEAEAGFFRQPGVVYQIVGAMFFARERIASSASM